MFTLNEILRSSGGTLIKGQGPIKVKGVSIDTRTMLKGQAYIAIVGQRHDGHDFIGEAVRKGASVILSQRPVQANGIGGCALIRVPDTTKALGNIAKFQRKRFDIPIVALTGSNGKTTTKDMLKQILSTKFNTLKNIGTQNNHIGVALTLLKLDKLHDICVIEMGTNHFGEISYLANMTQPNIGILLNIGPGHLEFFGDLKGVSKAKMEMFENFSNNGAAILNFDDKLIRKNAPKIKHIVKFGVSDEFDYFAKDIVFRGGALNFLLNNKVRVRLNMLGSHNVHNALAAVSCANLLGISLKDAAGALEDFTPPSGRLEQLKLKDFTVINDSYNANPGSMLQAIRALAEFGGSRKIMVAADMLELGKDSEKLHARIGAVIKNFNIDMLITVGELSQFIHKGAREAGMRSGNLRHFLRHEDAARFLKSSVKADDVVLLKGSHSMDLSRIIELMKE